MMTYPRLSIEDFGAALLATEDLDPVYVVLVRAKPDRALLLRWLVAYWCCYDSGVSSWIAEQEDFWGEMMTMAVNTARTPIGPRWPRGRERRHFRGQAAIKAVAQLGALYPLPERLVYALHPSGGAAVPYAEVRRRVVQLPMFGPWIAFKVADMLERVLHWPVDFAEADILMFAEPQAGALLWWKSTVAQPGHLSDAEAVKWTARVLVGHFMTQQAPPSYDRPVNLQEVETILCKFKAHVNGHYPVGADTRELRRGLAPWAAVSPLAASLLAAVPEAKGDDSAQSKIWDV